MRIGYNRRERMHLLAKLSVALLLTIDMAPFGIDAIHWYEPVNPNSSVTLLIYKDPFSS